MILQLRITQGLGDGGVVYFAVPMSTIPNQVNNDAGAECVAVFDCERGDAHNCFGILCVYVKDWDRKTFRDIRGEARGVRLTRLRSKADEVVDDHMNATANGKAIHSGKIHSLGPNALAGESGVAVNDDQQHLFFPISALPHLLGAGSSHGNRVHSFEMAWV